MHTLKLDSRGFLILIALSFALISCKKDEAPTPQPQHATRAYRMGFTGIPPRADINLVIASIDLWSRRADAAMIAFEPPWDSLLAGVSPETLVVREQLGLANYYRAKGHQLYLYLDPNNGLNRSADSDALVRHGRSMREPAIQQLFRRYAVVADSIIHPEHFGTALETNLIRGLAPPELYAAVKHVANGAAADIRAKDTIVKLSVSVQVDYAWGRFVIGGGYGGIETDFNDFPFIQELGLSSYPYLAGYAIPEDIPLNYYARLIEGHSIPVMVAEGGWSSATLDSIVSSPEEQRRYIVHQMKLLDAVRAQAVFQLTFTDLDLVANPPPPGSIIPLFAQLGLVDINLNPKPALSAWDSVFAIARQ